MSSRAMYELVGQVEIIKRVLRYTRRQHTLKRKAVVEARDKKASAVIIAELTGEMHSYEELTKFYEKILGEHEEALTVLKAKEEDGE